MVTALNIRYQHSVSVIAQGKDIAKREKEGFYKKQGGNGTYIMVKPSTVSLEIDVNGQKHSCFVKQLIRDAYSISRVTEKQANRFLNDVNSGNILLEYSDERGLQLM